MHTKNKFFRSDVEGLRAIAILLVIGAHFEIPGLSAGFIGVDIFFVLSGFLITGILVREHQNEHRINLLRFYANRFRRLFPALATMLVASSLAAYWILPDTQQLTQSKAAAMAAVWLSNIHFTFADNNYFGLETSNNIFLHTWSLGVEEQFYLLWPLVILMALTPSSIRSRQSLKISLTLFALFASSLVACLYLSNKNTIFSFYMMPTRAWQFAAGGLIWHLSQAKPADLKGSRISFAAATLLLLTAILVIKPTSTYPGLLSLLPTSATCALLWAGSFDHSPSQKLLSQPIMQQIGRISYSWYLWHWPVLILGENLLEVRNSFITTSCAIAISLLLAAATHHFVENPIRFGKARLLKPGWQMVAALVGMVLINSQMLRWHTQTNNHLISQQNNKYAQAAYDIPFFYRDGCDDWYQSHELKPCIYGSSEAPKTAVLLGDSIGAQWFPTLTEMFHPDEWRLVVLTKSSCPMVDEPFFYKRIGREYTECSIWRKKALKWIAEQQPNAVWMGTTASNPFTDQQWNLGTARILQKLSPNVENIYLIEANPTLEFNGPECLMQNAGRSEANCTTDKSENTSYRHVAEILKAVTNDYKNVRWIETASFTCPNEQCSAERDGLIVYRDNQHLTATFTASADKHFEHQIADRL